MTARPTPAPSGLPVLSAGAHRRPQHGSCVMEYVSVLAGEPWSDRPSCTHPALAHLARRVNDDVGDDVRRSLAELAPRMIGTADDRPSASETVVLAIVRPALERGPDVDRDVANHLREILRQSLARRDRRRGDAGGGWLRRWRRFAGVVHVDGAYAYLVASVAHRPRDERDALRRRALLRATEELRRGDGTDASAAGVPAGGADTPVR